MSFGLHALDFNNTIFYLPLALLLSLATFLNSDQDPARTLKR